MNLNYLLKLLFLNYIVILGEIQKHPEKLNAKRRTHDIKLLAKRQGYFHRVKGEQKTKKKLFEKPFQNADNGV